MEILKMKKIHRVLLLNYDELVASGKEDKETVAMMDQLEDLIEEQKVY